MDLSLQEMQFHQLRITNRLILTANSSLISTQIKNINMNVSTQDTKTAMGMFKASEIKPKKENPSFKLSEQKRKI